MKLKNVNLDGLNDQRQKVRRTVRYARIKDLKVGDGYGKQKSADFVKVRGCLTLNFGNY